MKIELPHNWTPRPYQMAAWKAMERGCKRGCLVWHRRCGKDLFAINWCAVAAMQRPGLYWHVLPTYKQGRKIVWEGMTRDGRPFLSHFPEELVERVRDDEMTIWLKGGSIYQVVGADDVDRLVGANPVGVILSEWSLHDPAVWNYVRPILAENGGWALFLYTPRGKNHGYDILETAKKNDYAKGGPWFWQVLTVEDSGAIPLSAVEEERASGMPEELIQQEFYCSFTAALVGSYYGEAMQKLELEGRFCRVPYTPRRLVQTAWDIGTGDDTAIIFAQQEGPSALHIIDYYEASGLGIDHYAKVLQEKGYVYGRHWVPHDVKQRSFAAGAKSTLDAAKELGVKMTVVPKLSIEDGINSVRGLLPTCWFDDTHCQELIEHLRSYRKEWDRALGRYRDKPRHDQHSHAADAMRTLALGLKPFKPDEKKRPGEPPTILAPRVAIV